MRQLAEIRSYRDLREALRRRVVELELSHIGLDELAGLAYGHTGKVLCGLKTLGYVSFPAMLDALGCELRLVESLEKLEVSHRARARLGIGRRSATLARRRTEPIDVMAVVENWIATRRPKPEPVRPASGRPGAALRRLPAAGLRPHPTNDSTAL